MNKKVKFLYLEVGDLFKFNCLEWVKTSSRICGWDELKKINNERIENNENLKNALGVFNNKGNRAYIGPTRDVEKIELDSTAELFYKSSNIEKTLNMFCKEVGISEEEMKSKKRDEKLVELRKQFYQHAKRQGFSTNKIGQALNRSHSTVCYYNKPKL